MQQHAKLGAPHAPKDIKMPRLLLLEADGSVLSICAPGVLWDVYNSAKSNGQDGAYVDKEHGRLPQAIKTEKMGPRSAHGSIWD